MVVRLFVGELYLGVFHQVFLEVRLLPACPGQGQTGGADNVRLGEIFGFQFLCNRRKGQHIIILVLDFVRCKFLVPLADEIIPAAVDQHIRREQRLVVIGGDAGGKAAVGRFHIPVPVVDLVVQIIALIIFLFIPTLPIWSTVVACAVIAGVSAACMIASDVGRGEIERVSAKVREKAFYIKQLQADVELLASTETDTATKSALMQLAEKIRYSDPMSDEQLADIEDRITEKIAELKSSTDKTKIINELNSLLDERNRKIKIMK